MKLSVTAVSANRRMTKTLIRARAGVDRLRQAWYGIDTAGLQFDTIQFVLMDRPEDYIHLEGTHRDDRLFQVHVGADSLPCEPGKEKAFALVLAGIFERAVDQLPIPQDTLEKMRILINQEDTEQGACTQPSVA